MRNGAIEPLTDHSLGQLRLAPSIFSVPRKDLSLDFSSQVALEASYHAAKHFFQLVHFDCNSQHHISFRFGHCSACPTHPCRYRRDFLNRSGSSCLSHRISVEVVSIMTSMNRRGTYISVTRRRQRRNSQSQRRTTVL